MRSPVDLGLLALVASLGSAACGGEEFTSASGAGGAGAGGSPSGGAPASGGVAAGGSAGLGASGGGAGAGGTAGASAGASSGGAGGGGGAPSGGGAPGGGAGGTTTGGTGGVASTCPSGGLQDLTEAFTAPVSTSIWTKYFQSVGTIDTSNGDLFVRPGMSGAHHIGIISTKTFSIDDCMMWVEVKKPIPPALNGETYFMAMVDNSMDAEITATPDAGAPSGLALVFGVEQSGAEDNVSIHYNATNHRWWRMRFPAGKVAFDTSPDGTTWTQRRLANRPSGMTTVSYELGAGSFGPNTTQPAAVFDNLNLPPP